MQGLPEIVIYYNTSEGHQAIATAIQEQWKAIGVTATLKNMEWKQYLEFVQNDPSVMVYRMGWVADFGDAYNFLDVLRGGGGNNFTRWVERHLRRGPHGRRSTAATEADRFAIYSDMEAHPERPGHAGHPGLLVHQPRTGQELRHGLRAEPAWASSPTSGRSRSSSTRVSDQYQRSVTEGWRREMRRHPLSVWPCSVRRLLF